MATAYFRTDQAFIVVSVNGVAFDSTSWDSMEGGEIQVDSQSYSPGGMQPQIVLGGRRSRAPVTVKRVWSAALRPLYVALDNAAGIQAATVAYQIMAPDRKTPVSVPISYTGVLGPVTRPNYDSMTSTPAQLQIVIDVNEVITG